MSETTTDILKVYAGRTRVFSPYTSVNANNILSILGSATIIHAKNVGEINYLEAYRKGFQPIIYRTKDVRPEINNKIVENRADEIIAFKVGYEYGEPVAYVSKSSNKVSSSELNAFNDYMGLEGKYAKDSLLAQMFKTYGNAYRLILPDVEGKDDSAPFHIYNIDPRLAFIVYSTDIGNKPLMGVIISYVMDKNNKQVLREACYTDTEYFLVVDGVIVEHRYHYYGAIPLIEYDCNPQYQGEFEKVIPMLDAINLIDSDCVNGIEQFIQAIMVFKNVDIDDATFKQLKDYGAIKINDDGTAEANVSYLNQELNQTQTTGLKAIMWDAVREIVGMPDRHNGASTSDTGVAVIVRDGWSDAESRAKQSDLLFKEAEGKLISLALHYCYILSPDIHSLRLRDIDIKFTRRNYENTYQKVQALDTMLKNQKIAPRLAFVTCGLFPDPESAYKESMDYYNEQLKLQETIVNSKTANDNSNSGGQPNAQS